MPGLISAYVGPNGGGKTLAAVELGVIRALADGREVVSTCFIDHPKARYLEDWRELPFIKGSFILLDEITSELPSRQAMSVPPQLISTINQLRKGDNLLAWTAPNWARADAALREVTQDVTVCKGFINDRYIREPGVIPPWWKPYGPKVLLPNGKPKTHPTNWPAKSLFRWTTYDATAFDEFTLYAVKDVRPIARHWYWRPWHKAQWTYHTLDAVKLLNHLTETGVCITCGGTRSRPRCTCSGASPRPLRAQAPNASARTTTETGDN